MSRKNSVIGSALVAVGVVGLGFFLEIPLFAEEWGLANSFIFLLGGIILLGRRNTHGPITMEALGPAAICWILSLIISQGLGWGPLIATYVLITAGSILMFVGIIRTTPNTSRTTAN